MDFKINSRIMIDFQGFNSANPSCRTILSEVLASADQAQIGLSSDDYVICNNLLPGLDLGSKKWCLFEVDLIEEINFNNVAFENLVLEPEMKELVSVLVRNHIDYKLEADDFIARKGEGLIFLIHGPPGVGKTLTAGEHALHSLG